MKTVKYIALFTFALFLSFGADAAKYKRKGKHHKGYTGKVSYEIGLGLANYYGDLCSGCMSPRLALGGGIYYKFNEMFAIKTDLNYYRIASKDEYESRGIQMRSGNIEFFTSAMISFAGHDQNYGNRHPIIPYVFTGLGFTYFNPQVKTDDGWKKLNNLEVNGNSGKNLAPIIPLGGGIKFHQNRYTDFVFEFGYRFTFSDYLDGLSENGVPVSDIPQETRELIPHFNNPDGTVTAGNPEKKDGYWIFMIKYKHTPHKRKGARRIKRRR